jgi:GR25 family glycosyltransferase involved in LPS biosynthesis
MKWLNFFDEIYVINLAKREDRLLTIAEHFEEYGIRRG